MFTFTYLFTDTAKVGIKDIEIVTKLVGDSWFTLGVALGFSAEQLQKFCQSDSREATEFMLSEWCLESSSNVFLELVTNLEKIGRNDISDSLIDSRMKTSGVDL